jgi:protein-disulfide isomerase
VPFFVRGFIFSFALLALGCSAQTPVTVNKVDPELQRKIELQIRNRFAGLPPTVTFEISERKPSDIPGWDSLTVQLKSARGTQPIALLISKDNKEMAHMERFKLDNVPGSTVSLDGRPVRGNPNAKVTVVSFDDFQCPYCAVMHLKLFPTLLKEYGDRVRFIYKDFPLEQIHPWAVRASVNANCIAAQKNDAYWEFTDFVHANQQSISKNEKGERRPQVEQNNRLDDSARQIAAKSGLDSAQLNACIQKQDETAVRASIKEGESLGIDGTPRLYVNGEVIGGDTDIENIRTILDRALIAAGEKPPQASQTSSPAVNK